MTDKKNEKVAKPAAEKKTAKKDLVEIELFKDNKDYKDDVFVCVNGNNIVVKRGKKVRIEKKYAEVLTQSMKQDAATAQMVDRKQDEYRAEAARMNI